MTTCATCKHWNAPKADHDRPADCRRYPPTAMPGGIAWPRTLPTDGCGEHAEGLQAQRLASVAAVKARARKKR